jgi:hypothetical protein
MEELIQKPMQQLHALHNLTSCDTDIPIGGFKNSTIIHLEAYSATAFESRFFVFFGIFVCFKAFFVYFKAYFLQYSSEKSQSWQDCKHVIPHHSCRVKMFSKSNHVVLLCRLLPQFVEFFGLWCQI